MNLKRQGLKEKLKITLNFFLIIFLFFNIHTINAQTKTKVELLGKVIDKTSGAPIPLCGIKIKNSTKGTFTNELGEFIVKADSYPLELTFAHLNFEEYKVVVSKKETLLIELIPLVRALEEVVLNSEDKYAYSLADKAFKKLQSSSFTNDFGKGFYRQKTKNNDNYTEFAEIIFDIKYNNIGVKDWDILEGRYALKKEGINNRNYTLFSKNLKSIQPNTDDLIFPLSYNIELHYDVKVIDEIKTKNSKIAVLYFKPKNKKAAIFEGEVYINTKTNNVYKVTGIIENDDLNLIGFNAEGVFKKDYKLNYEMAFKKGPLQKQVIDYIKVDQEFDYYKDSIKQTHISSTSNLFFYEYYKNQSRKKLGKQFQRYTSDWDKLNEIGYSEKFWKENPIVKRTPIEQEVIASFEQNKAFESIFFNSKGQVIFTQKEIFDDPFIKDLGIKLKKNDAYNSIQKLYIHTDKNSYATNEDLWYSSYNVFGADYRYFLASKFLNIELISPNNKIVASYKQELINGRGNGSIKILANLTSGDYTLRAYTNWMRNFDNTFFFTKKIKIFGKKNQPKAKKLNKIDLQFFPEGGNMIVGLAGKIAFKAIGIDGAPVKVRGKIIDENGKHVSNFGTIGDGIGFFNLKPKAGASYKAVLNDGSIYNLQKPENTGYGLVVNNLSERHISLKIQASKNLSDKPFYVLGTSQNKRYFQGKYIFGREKFVNGNRFVHIDIPKNKFPNGVLTLTVLDNQGKAWSERVVFINHQDQLIINAKINKSKLKARKKIDIDINVTDKNGNPVSTDLSVAVIDADKVLKDKNDSTILTHLLLESDVKGTITKPGQYFINQERKTKWKLDMLMLTNGWRRLNWEKLDNIKQDSIKKHTVSKGLTVSGIATSKNNKPLNGITLKLVVKSNKNLEMFETQTTEKGRFSFSEINFSDSISLAFNAFDKKNKELSIKILLDKAQQVPFSKNFEVVETFKEDKKYVQIASLKKKTDSIFNINNPLEEKSFLLNTVDVKGKSKKSNTPSLFGIKPDVSISMKGKDNTNFLNVLNSVSGVTITGIGTIKPEITIRGGANSLELSGSPLWVIDGISYNMNTRLNEKIPQFILNLNSSDIEKFDILKGGRAAAYGMRGNNGVIIVYTKRGKPNYNKQMEVPEFNLQGYVLSKEFYAPKYNKFQESHKKEDYRTTLFWTPSIKTDKNGKATISFYNSDIAKKLQIAIEGISIDGFIGAYLNTFGN